MTECIASSQLRNRRSDNDGRTSVNRTGCLTGNGSKETDAMPATVPNQPNGKTRWLAMRQRASHEGQWPVMPIALGRRRSRHEA